MMGADQGVAFKHGVDPPPQSTGAFSMDDADRKDIGRDAFPKIVIQQVGHLGRLKLMKIDNVGDRYMNRFHSHTVAQCSWT